MIKLTQNEEKSQMIKLTQNEEKSLEQVSERIARKIVSNCMSKEKDIEGCVASRVVGFNI